MQKLILLCACWAYCAYALLPVPQGFPVLWEGDQYKQAECKVETKPPDWVDGFLFAQTSASYGDQANPKGQKITHLFDAISAVSVFDVNPSVSTFTGEYYPTHDFKIWDFSDRDFKKSKIAWPTMFTDVNGTALKMWSQIQTDATTLNPNIDFWKIGTDIVAGTENYDLGLQFDLPKVNNFRPYRFTETDPTLRKTWFPIHMPIHEHVDPDTGLIWNVVLAMNVTSKVPTFHQVVFSIDQKGVRTNYDSFNFAPVDTTKCTPDGNYTGDISGNGIIWPRYMHTISGTKNYVVIPLTSLIFRPCQVIMNTPFIPASGPDVFYPKFIFEWNPKAPVVFLLFDKRTKKFLEPIVSDTPQFFSHQLNSYETDTDGQIYTDIMAFDGAGYDAAEAKLALATGDHAEWDNHAYRYTIDTKSKSVKWRSLLPANNPGKTDFSQINHKFDGKKYKYGYLLQFPFLQPNQILKIDVDTPTGEKNNVFKPSDTVSLGEPYFVAKPGGTEEDDGVIVVRGLDTSINKTRVYIVDAKTMTKVGEILSPTYTPFGLHERFYLREALGMTPSNAVNPGSSSSASASASVSNANGGTGGKQPGLLSMFN